MLSIVKDDFLCLIMYDKNGYKILLAMKEYFSMYKVYGDIQSGNCYKIKLLMNHLEIEHEWIEIDILQGETRTDEFLAKNSNGRIPVLELSGFEPMC